MNHPESLDDTSKLKILYKLLALGMHEVNNAIAT